MSRIPNTIRTAVAKEILARASEAKWEDLSTAQRSKLYRAWCEDPEIGGRIAQFVPRDSVRVWIKDGPMKEYSRARRGHGPYAGIVPVSTESEELILKRVFGEEWSLVPGSVKIKPAQFVARNGDDERLILWGNLSDLKHLVWGWLSGPMSKYAEIVVISTMTQPITSGDAAFVHRIGKRIGAVVSVVN